MAELVDPEDYFKYLESEENASHKDENSKWAILSQVSALLSSVILDLSQILEAIVDIAIESTEASRGFLILFDEKGEYDVQVARKAGKQPLDPSLFQFSKTIVQKALETKEPVILSSLTEEEDYREVTSIVDMSLTSVMCIPLIQRSQDHVEFDRRRYGEEEEVIGVLYVDSSEPTRSFTRKDLNFFQTLANQATAAIIHTRLYLLATTDALSGLYNRRQFEISLKEIKRKAEQNEQPFSLILLDIDYFKKINDTYGHDVGDYVIQQVAEILKKSVRVGDVCARYGGEEFALILPGATAKDAFGIAEKIRKAVEEHSFAVPDLSVTVSLGVASYPEHAVELEELVKRADQALYTSKEKGRNQTTLWSEEVSNAKRTDKLAGIITGDYARDYRNVMMLLETIEVLNSASFVEEALELAVDKVMDALEAERCALMTLGEGGELEVKVCRDSQERATSPFRFPRTIPSQVVQTGESVYLVDAEEEMSSQSIEELKLRAIMCVPLKVRGKVLGVLYADSTKKENSFRESELPFLEALAKQIAMAMENARLLEALKEKDI